MTLLSASVHRCGYGPVNVLSDVSISIDEGEAVVVLGANGAGKTTLLRALSGMIPFAGEITFGGTTRARTMRSKTMRAKTTPDAIVRAGMAHVPQGRGTITNLTVEDNLRVGAYTRRDSEVTADIDRWYEMFPRLGERRTQQAGSMSGGEQQMLAIARAFMSRPSLILLDEPSLGLAPLVTREVFDRVAELVSGTGTAVLVVEQNANLALKFATRGYVLESGEVVTQGTAAELQADTSIREAYLGGPAEATS